MAQRHGARLNLLGDKDKVIYVAQTIKSGTAKNAPYHIERRDGGKNKETFVNYDDDTGLLKAIRDALSGRL